MRVNPTRKNQSSFESHMLNFREFISRYQQVPVEEYPNRVLEAVPEPMVSVKVSTYQHADFIRDCLDGILMQETDFPVEILIGEDESSDGTREICKEYADRHPDNIRLFLHRRENNIAIHGRPTGKFQSTYTRFKCRGKYIALCEGDDYWTDPLKLQKQVDFLERHPEYILSFHDSKTVDVKGRLVKKSVLSYGETDHTIEADELSRGPHLPTASFCYRNVFSTHPESFLQTVAGDLFITCRLGLIGHGKYQPDIRKSVYRVHSGGIYNSLDRVDQGRMAINACERIYHFFLNEGYKDAAEQMRERIQYEYEKHIEGCRKQYHEGINFRRYKVAARGLMNACKGHLVKGTYLSLLKLLLSSARYFAGVERDRIVYLLSKAP